MAGRIRDEDIATIRDKSRIEDVIGEHVQLRNAGGGNLKGICPFHDEKSPSLSVSPTRNLFHCFGCGVGGDVIRFMERIEHLSFTEAVENLAARAGIQLSYSEGSVGASRPSGQRARLVEAHTLAAAFYTEQLQTAEAQLARDFLAKRGFDSGAARQFGCGYAPACWDALTKYLLGRGFTPQELTVGGLAKDSGRGSLLDRFHRRLLWPIRDVSGDVVGFGARRIHDDDRIEAKYLNTPDTPIYKKSQLLYGMDVAKREIAKHRRAVVVEGYTDVMACHLAGIGTAVATCGTAFGAEHINVLRRLLMDNDTFSGEVIFTFDGDAAGMKAAERVFSDEQKFMTQTSVAIAADGQDPCELRLSGGDAAVRRLIEDSMPLVRFVLQQIVGRYDVASPEGRTAALDACIPQVAAIKDHALRDEYARVLAGLVGIDDPMRVVVRVRGLVRSNGRGGDPSRAQRVNPPVSGERVPDRLAQLEREVIKAALQMPEVVGKDFDELSDVTFLVALHQQLQAAVLAAGGAASATGGPGWSERVSAHLAPDSAPRIAVNALAVEPLRERPDRQANYAAAMVSSLAEKVLARQISSVEAEMRRLSAREDHDAAAEVSRQLVELKGRQRELQRRALGGE